jgi:hypothetical protein
MTAPWPPQFDRSFVWRGRTHCEHLARDKALKHLCPLAASRVYTDADGVRHGYCRFHVRAGKAAAARRGWT